MIIHNSPVENVRKLIDDSDMIRLIWVFKCPLRVATSRAVSLPPICRGENRTLVVIIDQKLLVFQFKLLHRRLATNKFFKK